MTTIKRWAPFGDLDLWNRLSSTRELMPADDRRERMTVADWTPAVDIEEMTEDFIIKVELPELSKDDVRVEVEDGVLTIQGERKRQKEVKNKKIHRVERFYGSFLRSFTLPDNIEEDAVHAEFKDGMLYLTLHKSEKVKPKSIEVKID